MGLSVCSIGCPALTQGLSGNGHPGRLLSPTTPRPATGVLTGHSLLRALGYGDHVSFVNSPPTQPPSRCGFLMFYLQMVQSKVSLLTPCLLQDAAGSLAIRWGCGQITCLNCVWAQDRWCLPPPCLPPIFSTLPSNIPVHMYICIYTHVCTHMCARTHTEHVCTSQHQSVV